MKAIGWPSEGKYGAKSSKQVSEGSGVPAQRLKAAARLECR